MLLRSGMTMILCLSYLKMCKYSLSLSVSQFLKIHFFRRKKEEKLAVIKVESMKKNNIFTLTNDTVHFN